MSTIGLIFLVTLLAGGAGLLLGWHLASSRAASAVGEARVRAARAESALEAERAAHEERLRTLAGDRERAADQFRALAAEALERSSAQLLGMAEQRLLRANDAGAAALSRREEAVRTLVEPIGRTLEQVQRALAEAERARAAGDAAVEAEVRGMREASELLRSQTAELVTALRSSHVRGAWGELQLRRVVEAAGMLRHVDFVEQDRVRTDDGVRRPDLVVHLAGGKRVVVDAKVAFLAYLEAQQTNEPAVRAERLAAHARHVRAHVDDLAGKAYWEQVAPAPEFVVMFVPAEAFLAAALEADPALLEYAVARNVVLATPMTLVALLRTVAYAWRQEALAENAQRVLDLGRELHARLVTLSGHVAKLGRQIQGTADAYNSAVASLETRVLVSARRFVDLGVVDAPLPPPATVTRTVAGLGAPELLATLDDEPRPSDSGDADPLVAAMVEAELAAARDAPASAETSAA